MKKITSMLLLFVCGLAYSQDSKNNITNANELATSSSSLTQNMIHIGDGLKNAMNGKTDYLITNNNKILIRVFPNDNLANLEQDLKSTIRCSGIKNRGSYLTLWIPTNEISKLENIPSLKYSTAIEAPRSNNSLKNNSNAKNKNLKSFFKEQPLFSGNVVTQGDAAIQTNEVRANSGLNGSGITIGILSNSFAVTSGSSAAVSQAIQDGELPGQGNPNGFTTPISILREGPTDSNDEGRAMAEIIHDIAPGATILFRTAFFGQEDYADGIRELRNAGADIIVDDINFFDEPMFQDGIIAQAITDVTDDGAIYFTAALNAGFNGFDSSYARDSGSPNVGGEFGNSFHDFGTDGSATRMDVTFGASNAVDNPQTANISVLKLNTTAGFFHDTTLQWDDPSITFANPNEIRSSNGSVLRPETDLTLTFIASTDGGTTFRPVAWSTQQSILAGTPFDRLNFRDGNNISEFYLAISVRDGVDPNRIRFVNFNISYGFSPFVGTIVGHANSIDAIAVGAVQFNNTPEFGVSPPIRQSSSSAGGLSVLLDNVGNRLSSPRVLQKPEFMAPDGVNTTFFGSDSDIDADTFPNFFGTSAAAPHAAAAAVLILEAANNEEISDVTTEEIVATFQNTAIDMTNTVGFDISTGFGFIQAPDALENLIAELGDNTPPPPVENQAPSVSFTNPLDGANFLAGVNLGVTVAASDSDGSISNVRLFLDGTLVRQENITPYNWGLDGSTNPNRDPRLSNLSAGTYVLEAIGTDNEGATTSTAITITVEDNTPPPTANEAPSVSFTNPLNGDNFSAGVNLGVTVAASDSDGSISNVRLFLDGTFVRQENITPYNWGLDGSSNPNRDPRLSNLSAGTYVLEAIATDNEGATTSTEITITVGGNDNPPPTGNQPPSVSFTNPLDGDNFSVGVRLGVTVSASDSDGSVRNVRLFLDGNLVRQENRSPYNWAADNSRRVSRDPSLNNLPSGTYNLEAIATDNEGATASAQITITVGNGSSQANSNLNAINVKIYPIPVKDGTATIEMINDAVFETIQVMNIFGQLVSQKSVVMETENTMTLNVDGLPSGIYFIKMSGATGSVTKKIIID